jgi:hypothetical protein
MDGTRGQGEAEAGEQCIPSARIEVRLQLAERAIEALNLTVHRVIRLRTAGHGGGQVRRG